jgi:hypothetical protein
VESLPEPETVAEGIWHDLVPVLDQEVRRLPEKYRLPVVLCDLEGNTRREAAERLGWPEGTVAGRLAQGRAMLARRLARHGLPVSAGVLAAVLSGGDLSAAVPTALFDSTVRMTTGGALRPGTAAIAEGVIRAMSATRSTVLAAVLVATTLCGGVALWAQPGGQPADPVKPAAAKEVAVDAAWGKEVDGLQAGVGFAPGQKGVFRVGDTAKLVVYLRNVSGKELAVEYSDAYLAENQPAVIDAAGKPVATSRLPILLGVWRLYKRTLAAREVMELDRVERVLEPAREVATGKPTLFVGPGRYKLNYANVPPNRLSTGVLDVEVVTDTPTPVFGQDGWRFAVTYCNATGENVDLPVVLVESSVVLDGKEYPWQLPKYPGGRKMRPGEKTSFTFGAAEYLGKDVVLIEGKHTLTLKLGGQEYGPVEFEWRK